MARRPKDDPKTWSAFARNVEQARVESGLTKTELAEKIGISTEAMRKWRRDSNPAADTVLAASQALQRPPASLWDGWDEGNLPDPQSPPGRRPVDEMAEIRAELALHRAALERAGMITPGENRGLADAADAAKKFGASAKKPVRKTG